MTSADMITSLASMTSTASLASKKGKQLALYILSDFPSIRNLNGLNDLNSLNNLSGLNDLSASFHQKKILSLMFPSTLVPKFHILVFYCGLGCQKLTILLIFWHPFFWRLWRTGMLLLTKSKGHASNVHYSEFINPLQTKSNMHISMCQSQILCIKT